MERGLSQALLAEQAELDRTYIGAIERSAYSASVDVIERLAAVIGVDPVELVVESNRRRRSAI